MKISNIKKWSTEKLSQSIFYVLVQGLGLGNICNPVHPQDAPFLLIFYWLPCGYFSSWPYVWQYIHLSGQVKESPRVR